MRLIFACAFVLCVTGALYARAAVAPTCAMQKARAVSFQNATAKDVLEVTIGSGPCNTATLTIVIHSDTGQILYSYVAPFQQHIVGAEPDPAKEAGWFVEGLIKDGVGSTADLPPYLPADAYQEQHSATIMVSRQVYERLRAKPQPLFSHPTYFEGWKTVTFDTKEGQSVVVTEGGS